MSSSSSGGLCAAVARISVAESPQRPACVPTGQIGYALAPQVAVGAMLGTSQPIILHLLDVEQAKNALEGLRMELVDGAYPLLKGGSLIVVQGSWESKVRTQGLRSAKRNCRAATVASTCRLSPGLKLRTWLSSALPRRGAHVHGRVSRVR